MYKTKQLNSGCTRSGRNSGPGTGLFNPFFFITNGLSSLIALTALMLLCINNSAYAGNFGLNKAVVEISANQYQVHVGTIYAINMSDKAMEVEIQLENWLIRKGYDNELSQIEPAEWLRLAPSRFEMPANSNKPVNYFIEVPEGLEGELVAMAYFVPKFKDSNLSVNQRLGIAVYAAIDGTQKVSCEIASTSVKEVKEKTFITVVVNNTGNVHTRPEGNIEIMREGEKLDSIVIEKGLPVYPGKNQVFSQALESLKLKPGNYTVKASMKYGSLYGLDKVCEGEPVAMEIR